MIRRLGRLTRRVLGHSLLRNSGFLMGTTVVTSLLGYAYWLLAVHSYTPSEVGFATGVISTFTLVGSVFSLGVAPLFVRVLPELPRPGQWSAFASAGLVVTALISGVAGLTTVLLLPPWVPNFGRLRHPDLATAVVIGCLGTAVCLGLDGCFVSLRRSDRQFARNLTFATAKIPFLLAPILAFGATNAAAVIWSWDAALVTSAGLALVLLRSLVPDFRFAPGAGLVPFIRQGRLMLAYQLSWLGGWLPVFAFPILVVAVRGARENAYFYFTWSIAAVFFMVSTSVAAALFAEGTNRQKDVHRQARVALKTCAVILLPMVLLTLAFAHQILLLFGREYADHGAALLRICALGALPDAVTNTYVAVRQAQRQLRSAIGLNFAMGFIALLGSLLLLPRFGINAVGWSWTVGQTCGALWVGAVVVRSRTHKEPTVVMGSAPGAAA